MDKHTKTPWTDKDWCTTGPAAAAAFVAEHALEEKGYFFCRVAQHEDVGGKAVCIALGESQEEADANLRAFVLRMAIPSLQFKLMRCSINARGV